MKKLFFFGVSGCLGFLTDSVIFYMLSASLEFWLARLVSFFCAVVITWLFNRNITFSRAGDKRSNMMVEFLKYLSSMAFGGLINYISFFWLTGNVTFIKSYPIIGIAIGSLLGLFFNFSASKLFVFSDEN